MCLICRCSESSEIVAGFTFSWFGLLSMYGCLYGGPGMRGWKALSPHYFNSTASSWWIIIDTWCCLLPPRLMASLACTSPNRTRCTSWPTKIDDFETRLCKLSEILRSLVLWVFCDLIKDFSPHWRQQNLKAEELSEYTNIVAVDIYATILVLVGRNIIIKNMWRGNKWWCITLWIGRTISRNRTQDMSDEWREWWLAIVFLSALPRGLRVVVNIIY